MSIALLNPMFTRLNGRAGGIVFYSYNNTTYFRSYVKPRNPDTPAQRKHRGLFREAMKAWQGLSSFDKDVFGRRARRLGMTGHNLFISRFIISRRENCGRKASEDKPGLDMKALRRLSPSIHKAGHSVSGSIPGHTPPVSAAVQVLCPDGA